DDTGWVCPLKVRRHWPLDSSHSRSVLSPLPERAQRPSGLNATDLTSPVCPLKVRRHWALATSHSRTVSSTLPERAQRPSGPHATEITPAVCSLKVCFSQPSTKRRWARE